MAHINILSAGNESWSSFDWNIMMKQPALTALDYAALLLLAVTFLNLTGLIASLDTPFRDRSSLLFYAIAGPASCYLVAKCAGRDRAGDVFSSFVVFIFVYLLASAWHSFSGGVVQQLTIT